MPIINKNFKVGRIYAHGNLVQWMISHFYNFPQHVDVQIYSPTFRIAGKVWQLTLLPNGRTIDNTSGWFGVCLINHVDPGNMIYVEPFSVRIGIMGDHGDEVLHSIAERERQWYRADELIQHDAFHSRRKQLAPNDFLVIFCDIRTRRRSETDTEFWANILEEEKREHDETVEESTQMEEEYDAQESEEELADDNSEEAYTRTEAELGNKDADNSEKAKEEDCTHVRKEEIPLPKGIGKLLQDYKELLLSGRDSDMILKVQNKEFRTHRNILGTRSPVFSAMLNHDMAEKTTGKVNIEDIDPGTFPDFLLYIYTGTVENMSSKNVLNMYIAADKYQVSELKEECLEYMKGNLSVDNFGDIMLLSLRHQERELTDLVTQFFIENATEIVPTSKWRRFLKKNLTVGNELFVKLLGAKKE